MSDTLRRFLKNSITQYSLNFSSKILLFIFVSYAVRSYGTEIYGKYALIISVVTLFFIFSDMGVGTLIIKEIAKDKSKTAQLFYNKLFINIITSIIGWSLLLIIYYFVRKEEGVYPLLALAGITILFQGVNSSFCSVFAGFERLDYNAIVEIGGNILIYSTNILCVFLGADIKILIIVFIIGSLAKIVIASHLMKRVTKLVFCSKPEEWWDLIVQAFPFFTIVIFYRIYFSVDSTLLWFFKGSDAVGRYNPSFRYLEMAQSLPVLFMGSLFPIMSRLHIEDRQKLRHIFQQIFKALMIIAIPFVFFSFALSDIIVKLIYGHNSDTEIILTFQIIIWTIIFIFGDQLFGNFYIAIDRQKTLTPVVAVCAVFNVTANIVLIPQYGIKGAAVTSLLSEVLQFSIFLYILKDTIGYKLENKMIYLKIILISFSISCILYFLKDKANIIVLAMATLVVYGFSIFVSGTVDKDEILIISDLVKKRISFLKK